MTVRMAEKRDIEKIGELLLQVCNVHNAGRPDLFRKNGRKYTDQQLEEIIDDKSRPVLVGVDENDRVLGYAFCIFQEHKGDTAMTDIKTLYIDDLCVDEKIRGQHIGEEIYRAVVDFARKNECYNVTLNVWMCNERAVKFYEKCGLYPQKMGMETIL
ncbi:GNAT family N-acetyltransferase [Porcipelethomonas sp.]|uniref:GNAT family N-acetyltransferase n=1 Tax=Porcipelethomonas sp. TaxID=2981675 RepID=UPI003EF66FD6